MILDSLASVGVCSWAAMSASQMRVEDRLTGVSNWSSWKARMVFVLEDLELWDIVETVVPAPPADFACLAGGVQEEEQQGKEDDF